MISQRKTQIIMGGLFLIVLTSFMSLHAQWARTYGGSEPDFARSIQQTSDGGYIVAGTTGASYPRYSDIWILKLSSTGTIEWQHIYGGLGSDSARAIQQTDDGGYIVAGSTQSYGAGATDCWILKLSSTGAIEWQYTYGGSTYEHAESILQTSDGGYIVIGNTMSSGSGMRDIWILKLSSTGAIEWQHTYGGINEDFGRAIQQTSDGGYIAAGYTHSFGNGYADVWILKLTSTGTIDWQRIYGGSYDDIPRSIQLASDGGYIVAGSAESYFTEDIWILKLSSTGAIDWQRTYGGDYIDRAYYIQQMSDGSYIVAGFTVSFGAGESDIWIVKLSSTGAIEWQRTYGGMDIEYAYSIQETSDVGFIVAGYSESFGAGGEDFFVLKLFSDGTIDPSCGLAGSSDATIADTSVSPEDTSIIPGDLNGSFQETNAYPLDTNAVVYLICPAQEYALAVNAAGGGTTDPAPGNYTYAPGTHVTINAVPEVGYRFSNWSGDSSGIDNPLKITMDSDKSITAYFIRQYTLIIASGVGGTTYPSPGTYIHDFEEEVSIQAAANYGYQFSSWSGDVSGTANPIVIRMDADKSITANFLAANKKDDGIFELPCFIATAAYGSPLHPHVKTLRDFRDKYLMSNKLGRILVRLYYEYSPNVAKTIARHRLLKAVVRIYLLPVIVFSYLMVHSGPIFTGGIILLILAIPVFMRFRKS